MKCISCGVSIPGESQICWYHIVGLDHVDWAANNRLICNGIHRGQWPLRRIPDDLNAFY